MAKLQHILTAIISISIIPVIFTATVVEDLNNLHPPPDFNTTITKNCQTNPSLRYCTNNPTDLREIFKSAIVASHLCNVSNNPNCVESFPKIDLRGRPKIAPLYLSFTFFWKYCPLTISSIDLSNNYLKGNFPTEIFYCSQIQALDLSHNDLSGDVPVQNFSLLENLTLLNLSYNRFSECRIYDTRFFERFNSSSFVHSGLVPNHKGFKIKAVLLLIGFPVFVMATVVFSVWLCFSQNELEYTLSVLKAATDGFSARNLVAKTGRANVYRGVLENGSEVGIEIRLDKFSRQSRKRFVQESKILVQLRHENIVRVLGWCDRRRFRAIVTEWIDGVDIETWLAKSAPTWDRRVKVIIGVAAGISYLHEQWPEVGYSLRTRNVLLSERYEPVITRIKVDDHHSSSTKSQTTELPSALNPQDYGYHAEAYKFGMFVLEMATNRRPMEEFDGNETCFVEWVRTHYSQQNPENVIDKRMKKTTEIVSEAAEAIKFGLMCTDVSGNRQPSWDKVCDLLSNISFTAKQSASPDDDDDDHRSRGHKHMHHRDRGD